MQNEDSEELTTDVQVKSLGCSGYFSFWVELFDGCHFVL